MKRLIEILAVGVTDDAGEPLDSGTVTVYEGGTTTLQTVYQDWDLTIPWSNPLTLDAAGRAVAYVDGRVKLVIQDSDDEVVRTIDQVGTEDSDTAASSVSGLAGSGLVAAADESIDVNVDGATLTISLDQVKVADDGIGAAQIDDDIALPGDCSTTGNFTVGDATTDTLKLGGSSGIVFTNVTTSGKTGVSIDSTDDNFYPGGTSKAAVKAVGTKTLGVYDPTADRNLPVVTSIDPGSSGSLVILCGSITSAGAVSTGAGFSSSKTATGNYTITFTTAFNAAPNVVATGGPQVGSGATVTISNSLTTTEVKFVVVDSSGAAADFAVNFIAIGTR